MIGSDTKVFGFWVYLMTDLLIFAVLFATFAVLKEGTFVGKISVVFAETIILLTSSFTCAMATLSVFGKQRGAAIFWFTVTFALGLTFLALEFREFSALIAQGAGPDRSAFLSSYFTLVGTHGFHIAIGLLWMVVAIFRICMRGLLETDVSKFFRLALFWHFLDVIWIFIFTFVYGVAWIH